LLSEKDPVITLNSRDDAVVRTELCEPNTGQHRVFSSHPSTIREQELQYSTLYPNRFLYLVTASTAEELRCVVPVASPVNSDANLSETRIEHVLPVARTMYPHLMECQGCSTFGRYRMTKTLYPAPGNYSDILTGIRAVRAPRVVPVEDGAGAGHCPTMVTGKIGVSMMIMQFVKAVPHAFAIERFKVIPLDIRPDTSWSTCPPPKHAAEESYKPSQQRFVFASLHHSSHSYTVAIS
jgi:hypothetical protein